VGLPGSLPAEMTLSGCNTFAAPLSFVFASAIGSTYDQTMLDRITNYTIAMFGNEGGVIPH
ncbi:MAG TPA: hypothetical protein VHS78_15590, partial [Candidatus Elarobacter sp.]|nr:hypothetical protein [Candidatus Elarobacter sp.]